MSARVGTNERQEVVSDSIVKLCETVHADDTAQHKRCCNGRSAGSNESGETMTGAVRELNEESPTAQTCEQSPNSTRPGFTDEVACRCRPECGCNGILRPAQRWTPREPSSVQTPVRLRRPCRIYWQSPRKLELKIAADDDRLQPDSNTTTTKATGSRYQNKNHNGH